MLLRSEDHHGSQSLGLASSDVSSYQGLPLDAPSQTLCVIRGAGDLATGIILTLVRAGFPCIALEVAQPTVIRRTVSFAQAIFEPTGTAVVEEVVARTVQTWDEGCALAFESALRPPYKRQVPLLIDPTLDQVKHSAIKPYVLIDAIIAKRNLGTYKEMAPLVIAVGPGFEAGVDCDMVIESMRGHDLGRIITQGSALPNTGVPGEIGGVSCERVIHAPCAGKLCYQREIGESVGAGEVIARIEPVQAVTSDRTVVDVLAPIAGVIRGMIAPASRITHGLKMADIDPRPQAVNYCYTVSDKARALGGAVLTAIYMANPAPLEAVGD